MQKQLVSIVLTFVLGVLCATSYLHFYHQKIYTGQVTHKTKPLNHSKTRARISFVKIVKATPASEVSEVFVPLASTDRDLDFFYLPVIHEIDFHYSLFRPPIPV